MPLITSLVKGPGCLEHHKTSRKPSSYGPCASRVRSAAVVSAAERREAAAAATRDMPLIEALKEGPGYLEQYINSRKLSKCGQYVDFVRSAVVGAVEQVLPRGHAQVRGAAAPGCSSSQHDPHEQWQRPCKNNGAVGRLRGGRKTHHANPAPNLGTSEGARPHGRERASN